MQEKMSEGSVGVKCYYFHLSRTLYAGGEFLLPGTPQTASMTCYAAAAIATGAKLSLANAKLSFAFSLTTHHGDIIPSKINFFITHVESVSSPPIITGTLEL